MSTGKKLFARNSAGFVILRSGEVSNYNKLENNKFELSVNRMMEIVNILKIDIHYLLETENTHNVSQLFHDNNGFVTGNYNTNYICENIDDVVSKRKER